MSLSDLRSSEIPVVFEVNSFSSTVLLFRVTKSLRECEKWILYKILHRFSGPIFFLTQNFSMEKIILKSGKIFSRKISNFIKPKKYFLWKMKISEIFVFKEIFFRLYDIWKFSEKYFSLFKIIFFIEIFWARKKIGPLSRCKIL